MLLHYNGSTRPVHIQVLFISWYHSVYSPNGRFLVQETFHKTLPRFVLILISLQRWQHRAFKETKHFVSPHLIGPQLHQLGKRCVDWSISCDLLGADICGELPELSETNAEEYRGTSPLCSGEYTQYGSSYYYNNFLTGRLFLLFNLNGSDKDMFYKSTCAYRN